MKRPSQGGGLESMNGFFPNERGGLEPTDEPLADHMTNVNVLSPGWLAFSIEREPGRRHAKLDGEKRKAMGFCVFQGLGDGRHLVALAGEHCACVLLELQPDLSHHELSTT